MKKLKHEAELFKGEGALPSPLQRTANEELVVGSLASALPERVSSTDDPSGGALSRRAHDVDHILRRKDRKCWDFPARSPFSVHVNDSYTLEAC